MLFTNIFQSIADGFTKILALVCLMSTYQFDSQRPDRAPHAQLPPALVHEHGLGGGQGGEHDQPRDGGQGGDRARVAADGGGGTIYRLFTIYLF